MNTLPPELLGLIRHRDWEAVHAACTREMTDATPDQALIHAARVIQAMDMLTGGLHTDPEACRAAGWILMLAGADDHAVKYLQMAETIQDIQAKHQQDADNN
ncbi:hypothetical protein [Desulfocurvus sp. DL9XJH121]